LRIIGGNHRGLTLAALGKGDAEAHLRPTSDRVRENLFNVLLGGRFGDPVRGARVLDLFAGTGALGLEALSRGAAHCVFVDDGKVAQRLIRDNVARARREGDTTLLARDATRLPPNIATPCGLVFLDPPYGMGLGEKALATASAGGWVAPEAVIVWEERAPQAAPSGFGLLDQRRYGDTFITLMQANPLIHKP
jgi:16S rRNA (guanine966-N2)-methyltransferase